MFHRVHFLFSDVLSRVPMISTSSEFTYNEWVQGSKIVHFTMLAPYKGPPIKLWVLEIPKK